MGGSDLREVVGVGVKGSGERGGMGCWGWRDGSAYYNALGDERLGVDGKTGRRFFCGRQAGARG